MAPLTLPAQPEPAQHSSSWNALQSLHKLPSGLLILDEQDGLLDSRLSCLGVQDVCEAPKLRAAEGLEHQNADLEITVSDKTGGSKSGALVTQGDSASENCDLLKQVIDAWDDLSPTAKALIAKMVNELRG